MGRSDGRKVEYYGNEKMMRRKLYILLSRTLSRAPRERHHVLVQLAGFLSADEPTLGDESLGIRKNGRIVMVHVRRRADNRLRGTVLILARGDRKVKLNEQALTPGGIRCPQSTAPVGGTTRGKRPGVPEEPRRDSLMTPRRYGSLSSSAHSSHVSFLGMTSRSSAWSFFSILGSLRTL